MTAPDEPDAPVEGARDPDAPREGAREDDRDREPDGEPDGRLARQVARRVMQRIRPLRDARMRMVAMSQSLIEMSEELTIHAMVALMQGARTGSDVGYTLAIETLVALLGDEELMPYKRRSSLYAAAKNLERPEIARLFFDASPNESNPALELPGGVSEWRPTPRGRALTLGERKSLARAPRRDALALVMRDPHPDVIRILLGNPSLTESDVLQIASRRPIASATLDVVAENPRWGARYPVKRALVKNPYTAVHLALRLMTTLRETDLRVISHDEQLDAVVREQARALLDT